MCKSKVFIVGFMIVTLAVATSGCATVFHWERVNQPREEEGNIDVGMLIYDVLFIAFYGAGLIALLVDFVDGAIYVPKSHQPWAQRR